MSFIDVKQLAHKFHITDAEGNVIQEKWAVKDVDFQAVKGKFIAVIGKNGSGKSTFARHLNGLLVPDEGTVLIAGKDTTQTSQLLDIRKTVGMIFQNPDNQIVGNSVAEDVGFGLENLGIESNQIWKQVYEALEQTGLSGYVNRNANRLSGGQKQRLAIASVMAMKPECIVMDEATAMLDPAGSRQILELVRTMNQKYGFTIIMITHHISEIAQADYVYVMKDGNIYMEGTPKTILSQPEQLEAAGLETVFSQRVWHTLAKVCRKNDKICAEKQLPETMQEPEGECLQEDAVLDMDSLVEKLREIIVCKPLVRTESAFKEPELSSKDGGSVQKIESKSSEEEIQKNFSMEQPVIIKAEHVDYMYTSGQNKIQALKDISFQIRKGEMVAVVGQTGSGKSTLLQLLNGLLRTDTGTLVVNDIIIQNEKNLKKLRQKIGFVFQYPEYQLFETTVLKDVMYGPLNFGFSKEEAKQSAIRALELVGIAESQYEQSPLDLSGGQKKKVALAGILAYQPEILILDEPMAGLDAESRKNLFAIIKTLNEKQGITVLMVSHDMNDVYEMTNHLLVMHQGRLVYDGDVEGALADADFTQQYDLEIPDIIQFRQKLAKDIPLFGRNLDEIVDEIQAYI